MTGNHCCVVTDLVDRKLIHMEKIHVLEMDSKHKYIFYLEPYGPHSTLMQVHCPCACNFQQSNLS